MVIKKMPCRSSKLLSIGVLLAVVFGFAASLSPVKADKTPNAEEIVEKTILIYGSRLALYGVQRNGIIRSLVKFFSPTGTREGKSAIKFIRKEKMKDDLSMIQLEMPDMKYSIGFDGKDLWTILDGEVRQASEEEIKSFRTAQEHSYEALLRYKENNCKLEYVGSTKLGTIDLDIIDMIAPDGTRTRYEISHKSYHIIYIHYEDKQDPKGEPQKYKLYFKNFRYIQNSLVPYETQVFLNGTLVEERKVVEAVFNVQLEEKAFKSENAEKPAAPNTPDKNL